VEGLIHEEIFEAWKELRKGIMIYIDHKELTTQKRRQAAAAFRKAGKILEEATNSILKLNKNKIKN